MTALSDKVDAAFRSGLKLDTSVDLVTMEYHSSPGWDSGGHMALVAALEQEFDCMLEMDDILDMSSYAKVLEVMSKYG